MKIQLVEIEYHERMLFTSLLDAITYCEKHYKGKTTCEFTTISDVLIEVSIRILPCGVRKVGTISTLFVKGL